MELKSQLKPLTSFSFVSLADIILTLLIFFLLSSAFIIQPGIRVQLPKTKTAESETKRNIIISLTKENEIYLNYKKISWEDFGHLLYQEVTKTKEGIIVLMADKDVSLSQAVKVLDTAKAAGGERFLIATQPEGQ